MTAPLHVLRLTVPAGAISILLTPEDGVVRASGFTSPEALVARMAAGLASRGTEPGDRAGRVATAVLSYADGRLAALDEVEVEQPGSVFLQRAWQAMRGVPAGSTTTYSRLAGAVGNPGAVRAVGSACARNLLAPFVPCHRVLRTDGGLGGFRYGLDVKRGLLAHEGAGVGGP